MSENNTGRIERMRDGAEKTGADAHTKRNLSAPGPSPKKETKFAAVAIPAGGMEASLLTYGLPSSCLGDGQAFSDCAGCRVHVKLRGRSLVGLVMRLMDEPDFDSARIQPIEGLLDRTPVLDAEALKFVGDVAAYYHQPVGMIAQMSLPRDSLAFRTAYQWHKAAVSASSVDDTLFELNDTLMAILKRAQSPLDEYQLRGQAIEAMAEGAKKPTLKSIREFLEQCHKQGVLDKHRMCKTELSGRKTGTGAAVPAGRPPADSGDLSTRSIDSPDDVSGSATGNAAADRADAPDIDDLSAGSTGGPDDVSGSAEAVRADADADSKADAPADCPAEAAEAGAAAEAGQAPAASADPTHRQTSVTPRPFKVNPPGYQMNATQQSVIDSVVTQFGSFAVDVLHGVTGSGKTDVYLRCIEAALNGPGASGAPAGAAATGEPGDISEPGASGASAATPSPPAASTDPATAPAQVLILVPEISLAPQIHQRLTSYLDAPAAISHYKIGNKLRAQVWRDAAIGRVRVLIGTRSSVFMPFANLRLIIIDEEHSHLYKEADKACYHARDVAIWRAQRLSIPVILGSATPSCATWRNLGKKHYHLLSLPERVEGIALPKVKMIDLKKERVYSGFGQSLIDTMNNCLEAGRQVMIYHNSRGYAPALFCLSCERVIPCRNCHVAMHLHQRPSGADFLWCHRCLSRINLKRGCPDCGSDELSPVGQSTQQIEQVIKSKFPSHSCLRLDSDSAPTNTAVREALRRIHEGEAQILIGTQMLVKGHHFPGVGLVAVLQPDMLLFSSDLFARERLVQDLVQVAGRSGREQSGQVIIQTRYPDEPLYGHVRKHDYLGAMDAILAERQSMAMPPYRYLAIVRFGDVKQQRLLDNINRLAHQARRRLSDKVQLFAPVLPVVAYERRAYRAHAWLVAADRRALGAGIDRLIDECRAQKITGWQVDVDPVSAD